MWNWVLKKGFSFLSFCLLFLLQKWELFVDLVCALSLSLSLSLCNPIFLLQSLPVVVFTGCFYLKRERERERERGESQIVQVFAPISLVIFVVLTGFCLMRDSQIFVHSEFPSSSSSYSTHYFYFYLYCLGFVDLLWIYVLFNNQCFFFWFFFTSTFYLCTYFSSYLSHPPTYLLTYLPTYLPTYLIINLSTYPSLEVEKVHLVPLV